MCINMCMCQAYVYIFIYIYMYIIFSSLIIFYFICPQTGSETSDTMYLTHCFLKQLI